MFVSKLYQRTAFTNKINLLNKDKWCGLRWINFKNHNLKVIFMVFTTCPPQTTSFIDVIYHLPRRFNNDWNVPTMILGKFWRKSTKKWFYYSNYWYKVNHRICYILHSGSLSDSRLSLVKFTKAPSGQSESSRAFSENEDVANPVSDVGHSIFVKMLNSTNSTNSISLYGLLFILINWNVIQTSDFI